MGRIEIKQYDIVLVNLNPTIGSEIKKTRPCIVVSPDEMNKYLNTIVVVPMTSVSKNYPTRVKIIQNRTIGWAIIDQIRTIDRARIIKVIDAISESEKLAIKEIIQKTYVD